MKRHWLRGMLLGVSLALLLAGGVALAQGLSGNVDEECVECCPLDPEMEDCPDEYVVDFSVTGFQAGDPYCEEIFNDGELIEKYCGDWPADPPHVGFFRPWYCESVEEWEYGVWKIRWTNPDTGDWDEATWLLAEDCAAAMFVPEAGTLMLLGTGLAGLAGYAGLRWRTGE